MGSGQLVGTATLFDLDIEGFQPFRRGAVGVQCVRACEEVVEHGFTLIFLGPTPRPSDLSHGSPLVRGRTAPPVSGGGAKSELTQRRLVVLVSEAPQQFPNRVEESP